MQYAIKVSDSPSASEFLAVKLPRNARKTFNPMINPQALGKEVVITGVRKNYANLPGMRNVSSIEFVETGAKE